MTWISSRPSSFVEGYPLPIGLICIFIENQMTASLGPSLGCYTCISLVYLLILCLCQYHTVLTAVVLYSKTYSQVVVSLPNYSLRLFWIVWVLCIFIYIWKSFCQFLPKKKSCDSEWDNIYSNNYLEENYTLQYWVF